MKKGISELDLQYYWRNHSTSRDFVLNRFGFLMKVLDAGRWNRYEGPDFIQAVIEVDGVQWKGDVEIHVESREWRHHRHEYNDHYRNVILHVVWNDNDSTQWAPFTVELQDQLNSLPTWEPENVRDVDLFVSKERIHRVNRWANEWGWERAALLSISRAFGFHINGDAFEKLALHWLGFHHDKVYTNYWDCYHAILSCAGLVHGTERDEIHQDVNKPTIPWNRKVRPHNHPLIRVGQWAHLVYAMQGKSWEQFCIQEDLPNMLQGMMDVGGSHRVISADAATKIAINGALVWLQARYPEQGVGYSNELFHIWRT